VASAGLVRGLPVRDLRRSSEKGGEGGKPLVRRGEMLPRLTDWFTEQPKDAASESKQSGGDEKQCVCCWLAIGKMNAGKATKNG